MSSPDRCKIYKRNSDDLSESLCAMQNERLEIFKQQNLEEGIFDIAFEVEGQTLHAHKYIIASVSETMKCWLSDRWTTKDAVVQIENYSYDDFYEFLAFLYCSECKLTEENIVKMTDMAEFYGVQCLKEFCDEFLHDMKKSVETIEELFDFAQKYSLSKLKLSIKSFFWEHYKIVCKSDAFISFKKLFVEFLCALNRYKWYEEILFESVYKWAEHRVLKDRAFGGDESFNLCEAVEAEFNTFLPHFDFSKMNFNFLMDFVVEKGFILSHTDVSQYFLSRKADKSNCDSESSFKETVELAEKLALKKQEMFPEDSFNLAHSVKDYLVDVLPNVDFSKMDNSILTDFIVSNGIISEEQANQLFETEVEIKNGGRIITGTFKDVHRIRLYFEKKKKSEKFVKRRSTFIIRFPGLNFPNPSIPSTVEKMKGCDWYFCLDDGVLSFKHRNALQQVDYLIAEMKSPNEFKLMPGAITFLTVRLKNA